MIDDDAKGKCWNEDVVVASGFTEEEEEEQEFVGGGDTAYTGSKNMAQTTVMSLWPSLYNVSFLATGYGIAKEDVLRQMACLVKSVIV